MAVFLLRRTGILLASLVVASLLSFLLLSTLPGDPAQALLGVNASPQALAALRAELGTDRPLVAQYVDWVGGVVTGDLGTSVVSGARIGAEIADKLTVTGPLVLAGLTLALLLALPLGVLAAVAHRHWLGTVLAALSQIGIAVPAFWLAILLITVVAVQWQLLPAGGFPGAGWAQPRAAVEALVLPVVVLGVAQAAILMRYVRSAVLEVMREDFIRTARAKGASRSRALFRHGLRNAAIPVLTVLGVQLATLLVGAVVVENVFALPGLGRMLLQDVGNRDLVKVQSVVLVLTAAVLLINFLVDVAYRVVDPRLRGRP